MTSASEQTLYYRVQPVPPPTINKLTSRQKAQLRRSTTKLAKVLGEAPQVVDDLPPMIPHTYGSAPKKLQPSLSITSGKAPPPTPRRARSATAGGRVDPDLYPLSATLRPVSCDVRRSSESKRSQQRRSSSSFSRSVSSEHLVRSENDDKEDDEKSSFLVISLPRQTHPDSMVSATTKTRDSLYSVCDSVLDYEPTFRIPSATKMRRDKMARVCKILGEDVPVHLVFPVPRTRSRSSYDYDDLYSSSESISDSSEEFSDAVLDICAPPLSLPVSERVTAIPQIRKEIQTPPSLPLPKLKRKPVPKTDMDMDEDLEPGLDVVGSNVLMNSSKPPVPPKTPEMQQQIQQQQTQTQTQRFQQYPYPYPGLTYRASRPNLETIVEQSSRASYSSSASASSADTSTSGYTGSRCSLLTTTTSSSYRFTSSGCLSSSSEYSPISSEAHEFPPTSAPTPTHTPISTPSPAIAGGATTPTPTSGRVSVSKDKTNPRPRRIQPETEYVHEHEITSLSSLSTSGTIHGRREFAIYAPFRRL